jgi:uncharacterized protein YkwD
VKIAAVQRKSNISVLFALGLLLFALTPGAVAARRSSSAAELSLLAAVNATRSAHGLPPLRLDPTLRQAAESHSADMLRRDYFAHGNFPGRMAAFHVRGTAKGENLAWGNGRYGEAGVIVGEWLASPEHRAIMLRPGFSRIGIGLVRGSFLGNGGATVVTADFAGT